jgi:hypothetical protein
MFFRQVNDIAFQRPRTGAWSESILVEDDPAAGV